LYKYYLTFLSVEKHLFAMTTIFFAIGDFFQWSFAGLRLLGNFPNTIFTATAFALLIFWLYHILRFGSKDKKMR